MVQKDERLTGSTGVPHDLVLKPVTLNHFSGHAHPVSATAVFITFYSVHSQAAPRTPEDGPWRLLRTGVSKASEKTKGAIRAGRSA